MHVDYPIMAVSQPLLMIESQTIFTFAGICSRACERMPLIIKAQRNIEA
jgi:hypothetical protein